MSEKRDFFISFTGADTEIAAALNNALNEADFTTWFHPKDKPKGAGIWNWMERSIDAATQMIAICSESYFSDAKVYSAAERQAMAFEDPLNSNPLLILVKVEEVTFPRLIAQNEYISLVGLQAPEAAAKLVADLKGEQARRARIEVEKLSRDRRLPEVFNVPGGPSSLFTGREDEMAQLQERLKSNTATAITAVAGAGGIGKSTLAREYAHRHGLATRYGGVWWIPAESESGILTAYEALADHPGTDIEKGDDQVKTVEAARGWLARQEAAKPWLVIFDNAPDDESVAEWLPHGTAKVLITSRYLDFDPTVAEQMPLNYWDEDTTAAFLIDRAGWGSEAEARALAERLGGLPLAAEQAGAYLAARPTVGFTDYVETLVERLKDRPKKLPAVYPDSVWATTAAALDAVLEREEGEAALGILKVCAFLSPDGVELGLLQAVAQRDDILPDPPRGALAGDRVHKALRALTSYALLRVGEDPKVGPVLILHRLLAKIARARLTEVEAETWSGAAVRMIHDIMLGIETPNNPASWPCLSRLVPHIEALQILDFGPGINAEALAYIINDAAVFFSELGYLDGAISLQRRRVSISEANHKDNRKELAIALDNLALLLGQQERMHREAKQIHERALQIFEAELPADDLSIGISLMNFGLLYWRMGDYPNAEEVLLRAVGNHEAGQREMSGEYAGALNNLGTVYRRWAEQNGNKSLYRKAREANRKAFEIGRELHGFRHPQTAASYGNLATILQKTGELASAAEQMARSVAVFLSLGLLSHPNCQDGLATLHHLWSQSGQTDKAARLEAGDISDLIPIIKQIEEEHRAWVAEDLDTRHFGPPSPFS